MDTYTLHDRAVLAALDTLRQNAATAMRANAVGSEEYKFFSREHQAACKAEFWYRAGIRAVAVGPRRWYVSSSKRDGHLYEVADARCTCKAGAHEQVCFHAMLVLATETAADYYDLIDADDEPPHSDADRARAVDADDAWAA